MSDVVGLLRVGTYSPVYAKPGEDTDWVKQQTIDKKGIVGLLTILRAKKHKQEGKVDAKIFVLTAKTGAGKSTLMIYELFRNFIKKKHSRATLLCTQPKILLAQSKAKEVALFYKDLKLGVNVGYSTSAETVKPTGGQSIVYLTTQTLNNMLLKSEPIAFGSRHPLIVIDEAHETSIEILTTLRRLRDFVVKHHKEKWCPLVVITSATIYPPEFVTYFGADPRSPFNSALVKGTTNFPIAEEYLPEDMANTDVVAVSIEKCVESVKMLIGKSEKINDPNKRFDDILVMHKGPSELTRTIEGVTKELRKQYKVYTAEDIFKLVAPPEEARKDIVWFTMVKLTGPGIAEGTDDYLITFKGRLNGERRIFVSSPVAESGVTFNNLGVVIDSAWHYVPVTYPLIGVGSLLSLPISQLSKTQRIGRTGRRAPGKYIGLYTKAVGEAFAPNDYPSTILDKDASMSIITLISSDHLSMFLEYNRSLVGVSKLIAFQRSKKLFPPFDVLNDGRLLYDFSFDVATKAFRILFQNELITRKGQLTATGYQLALLGKGTIAETLLTATMSKDLVHEFDISLFASLLSKCFREYTFEAKLRCTDKIDEFFIDGQKRKASNPSIALFGYAQELVVKLANGDNELYKWADERGLKLSPLLKVVMDTIINYKPMYEETLLPYVDSDSVRRAKIIRAATHALSLFEGAKTILAVVKADPRDHFLSARWHNITPSDE